MTARSDGGPAFPMPLAESAAYAAACDDLANPNLDASERAYLEARAQALCGQTLRDYFAAKAMQGMLACPIQPQSDPRMYARDAYVIADAMISFRSETP